MAITIDDIPVVSSVSPVKESEIVYAANLAGGNPVANWEQAKQEIALTGASSLVETEKEKWNMEQMNGNKNTVEAIISDPNIPLAQRREIMSIYVQEGIPLQDLRNKFLTEAALRDISITEEDRQAQTDSIDTVFNRDSNKVEEFKTSKIQEGVELLNSALMGQMKAGAAIGSGLVLSIPAGLIGTFALITEQDPEKANELISIIQGYAYSPKGSSKSDEASRVIIEKTAEAMEVLDIPFKWIGDKTLDITGSPVAATVAYTGSGLAGFGAAFGIAKGGSKIVARAVTKGKPSVTPGSVIDTIETASKEQASNVTAKAMADGSERVSETLQAKKAALLNTYILPKIKDEFGDIKPDARKAIEALDKRMANLADEVEFNPNVYPVSQILAEREAYVQILTEVEKPHLLLSSSVLDIPAETKLFGRAGKNYEALVESTARTLEGKAVFGRNPNFGYKTQRGAENYMKKLENSVKHLPDPGKFSILEKDGQFYISWDFKRAYEPLQHMVFGAESLSAHVFSPKWDISEFANGTIGQAILPSFMRLKKEIPATGASAAREEARIEASFVREARDSVMQTDHPTELVASLRKGESDGKTWTVEDIQMQHPHLTKPQVEKMHLEYMSYRRIVDHLYNLADKKFRKNTLEAKGMQSLYDEKGNFVEYTTQPLKEIPDNIGEVWDLANKRMVKLNKDLPLVKLNSPIKEGTHLAEYAHLPTGWQHGPVRAGALTRVPGYIPRGYTEHFVIEETPASFYKNGRKVPETELRDYKTTVAMARTTFERDELVAKFQMEHPDRQFGWRKEEKDINDKIIHDSEVYSSYMAQVHRRGEALPSLNRPAEIEDPLVALTKSIRSVSKITAWDDLNQVRREQFVKAFGDYTGHKFPDQISDIHPKKHMNAKEEREFLAAQSIYAQMEREQISSIASDVVWRNGANKIADIFEKAKIDSHVIREWGEAGFPIPRMIKAFGTNLFLYWRPLRMWVVQPQQFKELLVVSPSYAKHLQEIVPVTNGLLTRTTTMRSLQSHADAIGRVSVSEYDSIIKALEESGIVQAVDMNQAIHGIWKDAARELAPKASKSMLDVADKTLEAAGKAVNLPGKIGRGLGYNPSELMNQVSLWLYSRQRWMEKNPGKNWNTPENRATIAREQWVLSHGSSTRAGMYGWQEGLLSTFTQFVAIPWKSTLQMISSPQFTAAEKARLAGARLFWYGKYGFPMGANIYQILERNIEDKEDRERLAAWTESVTDRVWNATLRAMFDASDEKSSVDTKNLSTVVDGEYVWDAMVQLIEMGKGNPTEPIKVTFPYEHAVGSMMTAIRSVYDIFAINNNGPQDLETWKAASWRAVSFAGVLSDFNKAMLAEGMSKQGNAIGYQQTRGEAVARLFGVPPKEESLIHMTALSQIKRQKEIQNTAKQIHERLISVMQAKSADENNMQAEYLDGLKSFLQTVPQYYKEELTAEIFKLDRRSWKEKKQSVLLNLYRNGMDENDARYLDMRNTLEKSADPEVQAMLKDLEDLKEWSIK